MRTILHKKKTKNVLPRTPTQIKNVKTPKKSPVKHPATVNKTDKAIATVPAVVKKPTVSREYCNKQVMLRELRKYKATGIISEELGSMFMLIAQRYSKKSWYSGYTEISDFVNAAVLRMVEQIDKFNPDHPKANPFAYFTQLTHRKFQSEKKKFVKYLNTKKALSDNFLDTLEKTFNIKHIHRDGEDAFDGEHHEQEQHSDVQKNIDDDDV